MPQPSDPHPTDSADARGTCAELDLFRDDMARKGQRFFIPDAAVLAIDKRELFLIEVKGQEMFTAPPFDGHGLPVYQASNYMAVYWRYGLRTQLRIYDPAGYLYTGWLDVLERFDTEGKVKTPRRIYPIPAFRRDERPDIREALWTPEEPGLPPAEVRSAA